MRDDGMGMKFYLFSILILSCLCLLVVLLSTQSHPSGKSDEQLEQELYCSYVDMWNASGQDNGHPDYKKVYKEWCK